MRFNDITCPKDLVAFLKGRRHANYYHYTTLEKLKKILTTETLLFTRGDSNTLNDQHEICRKGPSPEEHAKNYIFCLTHNDDESVAMWELYTRPCDAIRIQMPTVSLRKWIKAYIPSASLVDVSYIRVVQGNNGQSLKLLLNGNASKRCYCDTFDLDTSLVGYIKNAAWKFEEESRILCPSERNDSKPKIAQKLPKDFIKSWSFTTGPFFLDSNRKELDNLLQEHSLLNTKVNKSRMKTLLTLKSHSLCPYV